MSYAVRNGYKLVDGAYAYGNEDEVGEGLKEAFAAGVKREDVFVVSKVWTTYNTRVEECLDKSLKSLGLDYVDLYLVVSALSFDTGSFSPYVMGEARKEKTLTALLRSLALAAVDEPERYIYISLSPIPLLTLAGCWATTSTVSKILVG